MAMKSLHVEWRHLNERANTCSRCAATGESVDKVIDSLRAELAPEGVEITFTDTPLTGERITDSNLLLFNGTPLDVVLAGAQARQNYCGSCSALTQTETHCRTVEVDGQVYEEIPEVLIRQAALAALSQEGQS
jgi:hypothetical protein